MNPSQEFALLARARRFELESLAEVYDTLSPGLYAYARRLLGEDGLAEDCVAETFSRFLAALKAGRGPERFLQAYLYRIAHNWITDQFRRQPPPPLSLDPELQLTTEPLPEQAVDLLWQQEQVRAALYRLTPEQRQVVMLKYVEGWENQADAGRQSGGTRLSHPMSA
jgi:RNA polymerase sigma-70 factor, ECF subfamily